MFSEKFHDHRRYLVRINVSLVVDQRNNRRTAGRLIARAMKSAGLAFSGGVVGSPGSFNSLVLICENNLAVRRAAYMEHRLGNGELDRGQYPCGYRSERRKHIRPLCP